MHTCNNCGRKYEKYSKLERHINARNPCRPPTHHCDNCNKGFASYQSLWKHRQRCQRPSHYINYPVGDKQPVDIPVVSKQNERFIVENDGKTQSFHDAIINGDIPKYNELDSPIVKKRK